ncbi:unnamed protein product [Discosporangium mesarthrocarpum]
MDAEDWSEGPRYDRIRHTGQSIFHAVRLLFKKGLHEESKDGQEERGVVRQRCVDENGYERVPLDGPEYTRGFQDKEALPIAVPFYTKLMEECKQ